MRALRGNGACTCLHACARMSALASACSAMLMFVSCRRQLQHGQRHVHGRRKFKSIHVKQGGGTSFQHQTFRSRACFRRQTSPERNNFAVAGIRLVSEE